MSHSHLAIRHLIRKLEISREQGTAKPAPPPWLLEAVDRLAQSFEPFSGVARVGFECMQGETGWEVALFLGEHEQVGGADDGRLRTVNFRFDLRQLQAEFDSLSGLYWNAFPNSHVCFSESTDLSFLTVEGTIAGEQLRLQIHAGPPDGVGPAMRQHLDGRLELV